MPSKQFEHQRRWNNAHVKLMNIDLYKGKDDDIIAWFDSLPAGYKQKSVKSAIRYYLEHEDDEDVKNMTL